MADLEKKFKKEQKLASEKINEQLKIADEAVAKAIAISEQYGIPFYASVSPLGQNYRPMSFEEKWGDLVNVEELMNDYLPSDEGWEHSDIC